MRAMLLQVLYSVRSERQLVEQINYNLLFRWFVGLAIDDAVWNHSVFSKNRDRLIEHDAVIELFNATVEMAQAQGAAVGRTLQRRRHADPGLGRPQERAAQGRHRTTIGRPRTGAASSAATTRTSRRPIPSRGCTGRASGAGAAELPGPRAHRQPPRPGRQRAGHDGRRARPNAKRRCRCWASRVPSGSASRSAPTRPTTPRLREGCRDINVTPHVAQNINRIGGSAIDARTTRQRLRDQPAQAKAHRAVLRLGQGHRPDPPGDGAEDWIRSTSCSR